MTWFSALPTPPTASIAPLSQGIVTILTTLKTALEGLKTEIQTNITNNLLTELNIVDIIDNTLQSLVINVNSLLDSFLDDTGFYFLFIPLPKKGLANLIEPQGTPDEPGSNYITIPTNLVFKEQEETNGQLLDQILNADTLITGGNAHFLKVIADSLFDPDDFNKPQFNSSANWVYTLLITGSTDVASLMTTATFFDRFLGIQTNANTVQTSSIANLVPQRVSVKPSNRGTQPVIEWEPIPGSITIASYDQTKIIPIKYAIIRSTDFKARGATQVTQLFPNNELKVGAEGIYGAKVIALKNYDGIISRYIDTDTLDPTITYYYHIAFSTRVETNSDVSFVQQGFEPKELGFNLLSNGVSFKLPKSKTDFGKGGNSIQPDWQRTKSMAELFPALENVVDLIQNFLTTFASSATNLTQKNNAYVEFIENEINALTKRITEIQQITQQLTSIFETPNLNLHVTTRSGTGTVGQFLSDVNKAFTDYEDVNRPAFDTGDEFVTGVILLAVAPDPSGIAKSFGLLSQFFQPQAANPILEGINSIEGPLDEVIAQLEAQITPSNTFNEDMTPRSVGSPDASCKV